MAKVADIYFAVDPWKIIEDGFDPAYSRVSESVFSLANESIGVRGFFEEGGSTDSLRGSYINGVYRVSGGNGSRTPASVSPDILRPQIETSCETGRRCCIINRPINRNLMQQRSTTSQSLPLKGKP